LCDAIVTDLGRLRPAASIWFENCGVVDPRFKSRGIMSPKFSTDRLESIIPGIII